MVRLCQTGVHSKKTVMPSLFFSSFQSSCTVRQVSGASGSYISNWEIAEYSSKDLTSKVLEGSNVPGRSHPERCCSCAAKKYVKEWGTANPPRSLEYCSVANLILANPPRSLGYCSIANLIRATPFFQMLCIGSLYDQTSSGVSTLEHYARHTEVRKPIPF